MADLEAVAWPPVPIATERLVLRSSATRDRAAMIELHCSAEVREYLGGPRSREELERLMPEKPGDRAGVFVVEHDGETIGVVTIDRRDPERPGRVRDKGGDPEIGYMFLPESWRQGFATEACSAVMAWFAQAMPGEPLVVATQVANAASLRVVEKLGFHELERHEEWGAMQWFGVWRETVASSLPSGAASIRS